MTAMPWLAGEPERLASELGFQLCQAVMSNNRHIFFATRCAAGHYRSHRGLKAPAWQPCEICSGEWQLRPVDYDSEQIRGITAAGFKVLQMASRARHRRELTLICPAGHLSMGGKAEYNTRCACCEGVEFWTWPSGAAVAGEAEISTRRVGDKHSAPTAAAAPPKRWRPVVAKPVAEVSSAALGPIPPWPAGVPEARAGEHRLQLLQASCWEGRPVSYITRCEAGHYCSFHSLTRWTPCKICGGQHSLITKTELGRVRAARAAGHTVLQVALSDSKNREQFHRCPKGHLTSSWNASDDQRCVCCLGGLFWRWSETDGLLSTPAGSDGAAGPTVPGPAEPVGAGASPAGAGASPVSTGAASAGSGAEPAGAGAGAASSGVGAAAAEKGPSAEAPPSGGPSPIGRRDSSPTAGEVEWAEALAMFHSPDWAAEEEAPPCDPEIMAFRAFMASLPGGAGGLGLW